MASLNETPKGERLHIAFFGKRNAGKSSLVNAFTMQEISIVSDVKGTTTDPVYKAMELLPLGPVMIIDTPGIDDEGDLGKLRVLKAKQVLNKTDLAIIVSESNTPIGEEEKKLVEECVLREIPYIIARTKSDLSENTKTEFPNEIYTSAKNNVGINELRELCAKVAKNEENNKKIVSDLLKKGDVVVLVVPIDKAAPKGRLILPQQQ
ncbi:MAG: GTP-binding protein, partial [Clostridia bacterium]|nr:GTP-binding protein [Clostridia bacterium]